MKKISNLGWVAAAALAGTLAVMGLQGPQQKFGIVDLSTAFDQSNFVKKQRDVLTSAAQVRQGVVDFITQNAVLDPTEAKTYAELATKDSPTSSDKTQMAKIADDAKKASDRQQELATKSNLTPDDSKELATYTDNSNTNRVFLQQLNTQYSQELQTLQAKVRSEALNKLNVAVKDVAAREGYTVVFSQTDAPYAANDLTEAVIKDANSKG